MELSALSLSCQVPCSLPTSPFSYSGPSVSSESQGSRAWFALLQVRVNMWNQVNSYVPDSYWCVMWMSVRVSVRSVVVSETERLTELCQQWEPRVDDASVPEESEWLMCFNHYMLWILISISKNTSHHISSMYHSLSIPFLTVLTSIPVKCVTVCVRRWARPGCWWRRDLVSSLAWWMTELGRGEKTTCTDLQGFWDMVYYQVG